MVLKLFCDTLKLLYFVRLLGEIKNIFITICFKDDDNIHFISLNILLTFLFSSCCFSLKILDAVVPLNSSGVHVGLFSSYCTVASIDLLH